jgi:ribosomal protein L11 methyltransferase
MIDYIELKWTFNPFYPTNEIATVWLADIGYESFQEDGMYLKAYIPKALFNQPAVDEIVSNFEAQEVGVELEIVEIPAQNWNQVWEDSFEPVLLDHLSIVAPFHGSEYRRGRVIEIEPKMSFGTGHHQTTYLMCMAMENEIPVLTQKRVLDMGTGTGILAINAELMGATEIIAVDIEPWSVENTIENMKRNACASIDAREGDIQVVTEEDFDLILANINRNVLFAHLPTYAEKLKTNGLLMLSGFFTTDIDDLVREATGHNLLLQSTYEKEGWACLVFKK